MDDKNPACASAGSNGRVASEEDSSSPSSSSSSGASGIAQQAETSDEATSASSDAVANDSSPVHYYVMGPKPGWESAPSWPPPNLAPEPLTLSLGAVDRSGPICLPSASREWQSASSSRSFKPQSFWACRAPQISSHLMTIWVPQRHRGWHKQWWCGSGGG